MILIIKFMFMYNVRDRSTVRDTEHYNGFTIISSGQYYIVYSTKGTGVVLYSSRFKGGCYKYCDDLLDWLLD